MKSETRGYFIVNVVTKEVISEVCEHEKSLIGDCDRANRLSNVFEIVYGKITYKWED